ncbi:hypothetical protein LEP1GSC050_4139 [Leptospira broomii serovar Hurstbridge str. 5399]|uniref:HNH endonuclease domain protein n=1 Tax=Leptospira broomii serovar Hurstbridge str. 5399 TaxID=1049789 RepID=T0GD68_9LEPT|nr:hypothetical protein [Leptospira broomii]EQA44739.1 hypothetical protein LEP1GSC050_4139 [Leptospira broomii serovar Hurstbridge str. 5399]TGM09667.1 hypothetical protein EHQ86_00180 [Leptospira yasudae]
MKSNPGNSKYKFVAKDFYKLLELQNWKCYLTGRNLEPENTNAEHIIPLRKGGEHKFINICFVVEPLAKLKRFYTEEEIINLAADIIKFKGLKHGLIISQKKKK